MRKFSNLFPFSLSSALSPLSSLFLLFLFFLSLPISILKTETRTNSHHSCYKASQYHTLYLLKAKINTAAVVNIRFMQDKLRPAGLMWFVKKFSPAPCPCLDSADTIFICFFLTHRELWSVLIASKCVSLRKYKFWGPSIHIYFAVIYCTYELVWGSGTHYTLYLLYKKNRLNLKCLQNY